MSYESPATKLRLRDGNVSDWILMNSVAHTDHCMLKKNNHKQTGICNCTIEKSGILDAKNQRSNSCSPNFN